MSKKDSGRWSLWVMLVGLSLGCALLEPSNTPTPVALATRTPLATFTPTHISGQAPSAATPAAGEVNTGPVPVTPTITRTPRPTFTPSGSQPAAPATLTPPSEAATTAPQSDSDSWAFANLRLFAVEDGALIYGNLSNLSNQPQEIIDIQGQFFDEQNQPIAAEDDVYSGWPADVIPPGGQVPFIMSIDEVGPIGDYRLRVEAEPAPASPRQTFEFHDVQTETDQLEYCLDGWLENTGQAAADYLIIAATAYDGQGNVIGFGDYYESQPEEIVGEEWLEFAICLDIADPNVADYGLQAWGE